MRSQADVTREIRSIVRDRIEAGVIIRIEWATQEILHQKADIFGDDADFYVACAVDFIRSTVKREVGAYEPRDTGATDAQIVMAGFDHLQKAYPVERDGERLLVPVQSLTAEELEARALEYEAMARGCIAHAKELRAYKDARSAA